MDPASAGIDKTNRLQPREAFQQRAENLGPLKNIFRALVGQETALHRVQAQGGRKARFQFLKVFSHRPGIPVHFFRQAADNGWIIKSGLHQIEQTGKGQHGKNRKEENRYKQCDGHLVGNRHVLSSRMISHFIIGSILT